MAIVRLRRPFMDPFSEIERIRRDLDRVFSDLTAFSGERDYSGVFPPVNIYEGEDEYVLTAELPGVRPEDVEITITGDTITLKGERKAEDGGEAASYHRRERESGYFRRVLTLPEKLDPEKVTATTKNGVLVLNLPKAEEARPKQIPIRVES